MTPEREARQVRIITAFSQILWGLLALYFLVSQISKTAELDARLTKLEKSQ